MNQINDNDQYVVVPATSEDKLKAILKMAQEFVYLTNEIKHAEIRLDELKKRYAEIGNVEFPDTMHDIGLTSFTLRNGKTLKVKPYTNCRVPKENIDMAEKWLNENGHPGLVKNVKSIHHMTLDKFARDMEEANEVIPQDIFDVYHGYVTKIEE